MKKALIALLALSVIGTAAFAEDVVTFAASGDAQLWWGMDLDTGHTGFSIVNDGIQVTAAIGKATSPTKDGKDSYGMISIGNLRVKADTGWGGAGGDYGSTGVVVAWDDVVAKLVLGSLSVTFYQSVGTGFSMTGNGDDCWLTNAFDYNIYSGKYGSSDIAMTTAKSWETWNQIYFKSPGAMSTSTAGTIGFDINFNADKVVNAGLVVSSREDWTNVANVDVYAFKAYASLLAVDGLTFNVAANFDTLAGSNFGLGAKVAYAIKAGDLTITPAVAYDMQGTASGLTGGLRVDFMKSTLTVNYGSNLVATPNTLLVAALNVGMVDGLTAQVAYEMSSTIVGPATVAGNAIYFNLGYAIKSDAITITPFVKGSSDTLVSTVGAVSVTVDTFFLKAGVDVTGLLANTTFSLLWESNDMTATSATLGYIKLGCKVSF